MKCKDCNNLHCSFRTSDAEKECVWDNGGQLVKMPYYPDYWESLRHQAAISAMQGMLVNAKRPNDAYDFHEVRKWLVSDAVGYADALIEKLKKEK